MDFPHVDERTEERFTRLWPLFNENEAVKRAAQDAPSMIQGSREGGHFHFRLYEGRIPAGVDADKQFGGWATDEAKTRAMAETQKFRDGREVGERKEAADVEQRFPQDIRYYPVTRTLEGQEKSEREQFNAVVAAKAAERGVKPNEIAQYSMVKGVEAFVSKVGPIPELARWQTDEAKALWREDGERLKAEKAKGPERAAAFVERAGMVAAGKDFLGKYGKGLLMPTKKEPERAEVEREIREASVPDLQAVRSASEREFKALERKQFAVHLKAAQEKDPAVTTESFRELSVADRWKASGYDKGFGEDDFRRMNRMRDGFFVAGQELRDRGEHLSASQARDIKNGGEVKEQAKPVDEKDKAIKQPETQAGRPAGGEEPKSQGRQSSRGAAAAAALANGLGR